MFIGPDKTPEPCGNVQVNRGFVRPFYAINDARQLGIPNWCRVVARREFNMDGSLVVATDGRPDLFQFCKYFLLRRVMAIERFTHC
jgi:hypothetical protein